jgi:hypothetical protein
MAADALSSRRERPHHRQQFVLSDSPGPRILELAPTSGCFLEEVLAGRPDEPLIDWLSVDENRIALELGEAADANLVQRVVTIGYANDLTDDEIQELGRDPFLIAYALSDSANRCVVTTEVSKPSRRRQNRKIPDVCDSLGVRCRGPFDLNRELGFHTGWRRG